MLSAITHRRARGEAAELCFIARASQFGLNVSKPLGGCLPYDVIVGYASHLHRVQAKSTMQYDPRSRRYRCNPGRSVVHHPDVHLARASHFAAPPRSAQPLLPLRRTLGTLYAAARCR